MNFRWKSMMNGVPPPEQQALLSEIIVLWIDDKPKTKRE